MKTRYKIDFDKVESIEDIKLILEVLQIRFVSPDAANLDMIRHLLVVDEPGTFNIDSSNELN